MVKRIFFTVLLSIYLAGLSGCKNNAETTVVRVVLPQVSLPQLMFLDSYDNPGQARGVWIDGDTVYVADGVAGLRILSIDADDNLSPIASLSIGGGGRGLAVAKKGDILYVAAQSSGLLVIDVSTPSEPDLLRTIAMPDSASYLKLSGDRLYVSAGANFLVFDTAVAADPKELGRIVAGSPNQHIVIDGDFAYVAGYTKGLRIIDISDDADLRIVQEKNVGYVVRAIAKIGDTVYLGGEDSGVLIVDVSDFESLVLVDEFILPGGAGGEQAPYDILAFKEFLIVADGDAGVHVLGVTNPTAPVLGSNIPTLGASYGLFTDGDLLAVGDYFHVQLLDLFETTDSDNDGVVDGADAFPDDPAENKDNDEDGIGDNADLDDDNDGTADLNDAFPFDPTETTDTDGDGVGDNADAFPADPAESADFDLDGVGDNADLDDDNDGLSDVEDVNPNDPYNLTQVTFDANLNGFPKLDGDQIAWRGYTSGGSPTIYFQDLDIGDRIDIGDGIDGFHGIPALSNGEVVWRVWDNVSNYMIYYWDGVTTTLLTTYTDGDVAGFSDKKFGFPPSYHSVDAQIHNGKITWAQWDGDDYEIMYWDGATIFQITDNMENDYEPQINNGQIAWTGDEAGGSSFDVFFWDGDDPGNPNIMNVSDRVDTPDEDAHLMNGAIAWSGYANNANKRDIFFWNGVDNTTVISLPGNDYEPQIDNLSGTVIWHNNGTGKYIIYLWDGFGITEIDYPQFTSLKSPFANSVMGPDPDIVRFAFTGRNEVGPDLFIGEVRLDKDGDGFLNGQDSFPLDPSESIDTDFDGIGDNADPDDDNDGVIDGADSFPLDPSESIDTDVDGVGDNADFFPTDPSEADDSDLDGIGDNADGINAVVLTPVSNQDTGGQARGILKDGQYVYVADGTGGLLVYRLLADGSFSPIIGSFKLSAEPGVDISLRSIEKVDHYLYLAYREKGLYVLDITNPETPVFVTQYDTPDRATFIEVNDDRLYLSDRFGLLIFDISDREVPVLLGSYNPFGEIERIVVEGVTAYVARYYQGILVLDVSDPENLVEISVTNTDFAIWTVVKEGDYIFAGGEASGLLVYDASNLSDLVPVATLDLPDVAEPLTAQDQPPFRMEVHGAQLFIADGDGGLQVVDISDPLMPVVSASYSTTDLTVSPDKDLWDFYIDEYTVIMGDYFNGVHHINLGSKLDNDGDGTRNWLDVSPNDPLIF